MAASVIEVPLGSDERCPNHRSMLAAKQCTRCACRICAVCAEAGGGQCADCVKSKRRSDKIRRIRVGVLLGCLFLVLMLAVKEWRRRHLGWKHPQRLAVVLVEPGGQKLPAFLVQSFAARAEAVEALFHAQRLRYEPGAGNPIAVSVLGPVSELASPPELSSGGIFELFFFNRELAAYAEKLDQAAGIDSAHYDVRIYVRISESMGALETVEGLGQEHGRIGVVTTQVREEGVDFAWFVAMHEYLHTRGASDKYGPQGRAIYPHGFADPERSPLFPQQRTELMARGRPLNEHKEAPPEEVQTWVIGAKTAAEIAWTEGPTGERGAL